MSSTKRLAFCVGMLACGQWVAAQQFVIDHDLKNDRTNLYRVGKKNSDTLAVHSLNTKRSSRISLQVQNLNPFVWNARVVAVKTPPEEQVSNAGIFNPFSVLGKGLGGLVQDIIPDLDLGKNLSRGGGMDMENVNNKYLVRVAAYQALYKRYQALAEHADDIKLLRLRLRELKYSNTKSGDEIRNETSIAVRRVWGNQPLTWENAIAAGRKLKLDFSNVADSLALLKGRIDELEPSIDKKINLEGITLGDISGKIEDNSKKLFAAAPLVEQHNFVDDMSEITDLYNEIENANYTFKYQLNASSDIAELKLQIYPKQDSMGRDTITKFFTLQPRHAIKVRNSVGIAFNHFAARNRNYFVKADSTIGSTGGDDFSPVLSTYINFYPSGGQALKLGGSFGFGIPVTGERKDINYMLGLSAFIGRNEPVILSVGVAGTNVNVIGNGLKEGDKVSSTEYTIPKIGAFRIGYYIGVSFNLSSLAGSGK